MKIDQTIANITQSLISAAFREDLAERGDITADAIAVPNHFINARIIAKKSGVMCGVETMKMVFDH
ncbi:MAG: hypothetical protein EHM72_07870, partial [Calditrichaeota bacterium]